MIVVDRTWRHRICIDIKEDHENVIGTFKTVRWDNNSRGYLFAIEANDPVDLIPIKLKGHQQIFRYETEAMGGMYRPLILIDTKLKKPCVYFLTEDSFDGKIDAVEFEKKGDPIEYMWIFEDSKHLFN
jgi:hypothetical protein